MSLPCRSADGWVIYLGGLNENCSEDSLYDLLSEYGKVNRIYHSLSPKTGKYREYAMAQYREYDEALEAIRSLNGLELMNQMLVCDFAFCQ